MAIFVLTVCAEVLALVLRLGTARAQAAWVLALGTVPALTQMAAYFWEGAKRGAVATASDIQFLALELGVLALALLSQWRLPRLFFWLAWALNLSLIGAFAYLLFLWRGFT